MKKLIKFNDKKILIRNKGIVEFVPREAGDIGF